MRLDDEGELAPDPFYSVMHLGTVSDRDDPEKLGRVRLLVPGIFETPSPWAFPLGTGGGSTARGSFFTPEKGATVAVFFALGNYERPHFLAGHWARGEAPTYLDGMSATDTPNVRVIETKNFLLVFDDRSGSEQLLLKEKGSGNLIKVSGSQVYIGGQSGALKLINENCPDPFTGATHGQLAGPTGQTSITKAK